MNVSLNPLKQKQLWNFWYCKSWYNQWFVSACFSGERLCPGTIDMCQPEGRFCDGLPDCPNNLDEYDCCKCHLD